jgi:hypothetical protein
LHGEDVVVAVDDQARQEIRLTEDQTIGIAVVNKSLAIGKGIGDALTEEREKIGDRLARNKPDRNLG